MKKFVCLIICVFLIASFLESSYVGKVYFRQQPGKQHIKVFRVPKDFYESWTLRDRTAGKNGMGQRTDQETIGTFEDQLLLLHAYFESEEQKGNLRIRLVQDDPEAMMEHHRYTQYYKDLEVFGGEIIRHFKEGQLVGINGEYYEIEDFDITPLITKDIAIDLFKAELGAFNITERAEESKLLVYPKADGDYQLAYHVVLEDSEIFSMTGIVSAKTGELLLGYSNIQNDDLTIGKGIGYHGDTYKFPTTLDGGVYWLYDEKTVRPVNQYTYIHELFTRPFDDDNYWGSDGVLVNVHAYAGWTYDYYFLSHGRRGIDGNDMNLRAVAHALGGNDNANWHPFYKRLAFYDPGPGAMQTGAALDVVAHEYSHGVTQFTSGLEYYCTQAFQPGALNESFSDIMGTAVEFYWQDKGNGFDKADWVCGEDIYLHYNANNYLRSLSYPNSKRYAGLPYPCHLSQCYIFPNTEDGDWGGVHFNTTLYSHAYYLLSEGGTNAFSRKSVAAIGINKATKIFYRTWTHYLIPVCDFWYAAQALVQSAVDIYGSGSNECTQTIKAMEAIGW